MQAKMAGRQGVETRSRTRRLRQPSCSEDKERWSPSVDLSKGPVESDVAYL